MFSLKITLVHFHIQCTKELSRAHRKTCCFNRFDEGLTALLRIEKREMFDEHL